MTRTIRVVAPTEEAARRLAESVWRGRAVAVTAVGPASQADVQLFWKSMPLRPGPTRPGWGKKPGAV